MNAPIPQLRARNTDVDRETLQVALHEGPLYQDNSGMPVLQLLAALRQFHTQRDLSHQERFGTPDTGARQALLELGNAQKSLQAMATQLEQGHDDFVIEASLNLRMAPKQG